MAIKGMTTTLKKLEKQRDEHYNLKAVGSEVSIVTSE